MFDDSTMKFNEVKWLKIPIVRFVVNRTKGTLVNLF
jgi:hypothetical protein